LEHFKVAYDNKAFTLRHYWIVIKDSKKWEDNFALWQALKEKKKGKGNGDASMDGVINLDDKRRVPWHPCRRGPGICLLCTLTSRPQGFQD
jgi:hypothetical protein